MTQKDLCSVVGLSQAYLSRIEKGKSWPSNDVLSKIAECLEVPVAILFLKTLTKEDCPLGKKTEFKNFRKDIRKLTQVLWKI